MIVLPFAFLFIFNAGSKDALDQQKKQEQAASRDRAAQVFLVEPVRFTNALEGLVGTVKGDTVELTFGEQEEKLTAVHVRVGQTVKKGQILFELDHVRSEAKMNQAEVNFSRVMQLEAAGGATMNDIQEAQSAYDIAKKDFDDTFIVAPKAGHVSEINKRVGEKVDRNEPVGVLVSSQDQLYIETGVIESQMEQVARGQKAVVEVSALGGIPVSGTVLGTSREVTTTGRTGTVLIGLPGNMQGRLRPGQSARCRIITLSKTALVIPRESYDHEQGGVYVLASDGRIHFKSITLGTVTQDFYEAAEGLKAGEKIIADILTNPPAEGEKVSVLGDVVKYAPGKK